MAARLILSAIGGGTKLLAKSLWAIRKGKSQVKKGRNLFYKQLRAEGIPKDYAKELAKTYASAGNEILSISNLINLARNADDSELW